MSGRRGAGEAGLEVATGGRRRRIAYVSDQQLPNSVATSEQVVNMAAALAHDGAEVRVLLPGAADGVAPDQRRRELTEFYGVGDDSGVDWEWVLSYPRSAKRSRKVLHGVVGPWLARWRGFPLLYTRTMLAAAVGFGLGLRVAFETYHVLDRQRPVTAAVVARLSRMGSRFCVICHSDLAREGLLRAGADPRRVAVFHNGYNPRRLLPVMTRKQARSQLGWPSAGPYVVYTGRVDVDKGADAMVELARRLPKVTFVAVGPSEQRPEDWIERRAIDEGLANLRWVPAVPPGELACYLYAGDVLLIPPTAAPLEAHTRTVLPLKTFSYLAAGRPILAPDLRDAREVLSDQTACLVPADDYPEAARRLSELLEDPGRCAALAAAGLAAVQERTWERRAERIVGWLDQSAAPESLRGR